MSGIEKLIGGVMVGIGLLFFAILILILIGHKLNKKRRQKVLVDRAQQRRTRGGTIPLKDRERRSTKYTEASLEVMEMKMKKDLQFSKKMYLLLTQF